LLINFGKTQDSAFQSLQKSIENYIPIDKISQFPTITWVQKVMEIYSSMNSASKIEAKLLYLEQLKPNSLFQSHQFNVIYSTKHNANNLEKYPEICMLAILSQGILILDSDRNVIELIPYSVVASWGVNLQMLVLVVSKIEGQVSKHYFETNQTKSIQFLLEAYTNLIIGKPISEVMQATAESLKKFESIPGYKLSLSGETYRSRIATQYKKN